MSEHLDQNELDARIAVAARDGAASGFGPAFAVRTVELALEAQRVLGRPDRRGLLDRQPRRHGVGARSLGLRRPALMLATVVVLLVAFNWGRTREFSAPLAASAVTTLSDGTEITLQAGSRLTYKSFRFRMSRQVSLVGEAYFAVAHSGETFVVHTFNSDVVVTGTRFNVWSWPEALQAKTRVSLEEGGVRIEQPAGGSLNLTPGQSALILDGASALDERLSVSDAVSWRSGGLAFVETPLRDALDELERRFNVRLLSDAAISGRLTTYVDPQTRELTDVLDAICFALDLRFRPIQNGFRIESANSQ
ncbi:MAG: transmembrane sensor [Rhodothermales bacterium]|jgi:transmembrane sensor